MCWSKKKGCRARKTLGILTWLRLLTRTVPNQQKSTAQFFFGIEALEWTGDGQLLIWDAHYDLAENPGVTAVYDPQAGGIVQRLNYPLRENFTFWNEARTAFYSVLFLEIPCSTSMGGYDFARDRELPAFKPFGEPDQYVKVFDSPVWSANHSELLVSVSSGTLIGNSPCGDGKIEWQPSAIIKLNLAAEDLQPTLVKGDSDHDYHLQIDADGQYEIVSEPYVPSSSQCCRGR